MQNKILEIIIIGLWLAISFNLGIALYYIRKIHKKTYPSKKLKNILGIGWGIDSYFTIFKCETCKLFFTGSQVKIQKEKIGQQKIEYTNCPYCDIKLDRKNLLLSKMNF